MRSSPVYHEALRPQFHFTARKNWMNDPNGLVWFQDEYHMFFQHHADGITWGPMSWGHAVSRDLVHWRQLRNALAPDEMFGCIWSGSAVVDWANTSGLQKGPKPPLVVCYTSTDPGPDAPKAAVQCIAFSNDRGRTWTKYSDNPIMPHLVAVNRDPKVFWHEPSHSWVMALYLDRDEYALFTSADLRHWIRTDTVRLHGSEECPDFFELPVEGEPDRRLWVFWGATGGYRLGTFDGRQFSPQTDTLLAERGPNGYAAQTWNDLPKRDARRIQVSWMRNGKYPGMPFNQQMSFPVDLTLRDTAEGLRLCRRPVKEIQLLHGSLQSWKSYTLDKGKVLRPDGGTDLFDIQATVAVGTDDCGFSFRIHGNELAYSADRGTLTYLGREIPVQPRDGRLDIRLLVDTTSLEMFVENGQISASFCFLPEAWDAPLEITGNRAALESLAVHQLRAAWK